MPIDPSIYATYAALKARSFEDLGNIPGDIQKQKLAQDELAAKKDALAQDRLYKSAELSLKQDDPDRRIFDVLSKAHTDPSKLTPDDIAFVGAYNDVQTRKLGMDPTTGNSYRQNAPIAVPGVAGSLAQIPPSQPYQSNYPSVMRGDAPQSAPASAPLPNLPDTEVMGGGNVPIPLTPGQLPAPGGNAAVPLITAPAGASPKTMQAAEAANIDVATAGAKKAAEAAAEKASGQNPAALGLINNVQQGHNIGDAVNKAIGQVGALSAGYGGQKLKEIGGTDAADLKATLDTIGADAAFTELNAMRQASKTGGALGSVSERELSLLTSAKAALGQDQSPDQLKENLGKYQNQRRKSMYNVAEAYTKDYGELPDSYYEQFPQPTPKDVDILKAGKGTDRQFDEIYGYGMAKSIRDRLINGNQ